MRHVLTSIRWHGPTLLAALLAIASVLDPEPARASIPGDIFGGAKDLIGDVIRTPANVAGSLGATAMQEAVEWLIGDLQTTITLETIRFLTSVDLAIGGSLVKVTAPAIVIGGFLLIVGLISSVADGYREVIAGADTPERVIGTVIFRVIGLALLLGSWFWIVPLAVDIANGLRDYILSDPSVKAALKRSFQAKAILSVNPLFGLLLSIGLAFAMLALLVLKYVMLIAFAILYVGGPVLIGLAAFPQVGSVPLSLLLRTTTVLTLIPLAWTVVFVAWAGVTAGILDRADNAGQKLLQVMTGPALFLAGIVVIFTLTRRMLAMAAFNTPPSVPGAGVARLLAARAVFGAKGLAATAADPSTNGPDLQEGPAPEQSPKDGSQTRSSSRPSFHRRTLDEQRTARRQESLERRDLQLRNRQRHVSSAEFPVTTQGTFRTPGRSTPDQQRDAGRAVEEQRARFSGSVPSAAVAEAGRQFSAGDRSAFAAAAETAMERAGGDPARAAREYQRQMIRQLAGHQGLDAEKRTPAAVVAAADPHVVRQTFHADHAFFVQPAPSVTPPAPDPGVGPTAYDPRLFEPTSLHEVGEELERGRRETRSTSENPNPPGDSERS